MTKPSKFRSPFSAVLFLFLSLLISGCAGVPEYTQKFALSNAKPISGEAITVFFLPAAEVNGQDVILKVYEYKANLLDTKDYPMEKNGKGYTAAFSLDEGVRGAVLLINYGDETENNDGYGYYVQVHGKDGNPLPGSDAGMAYAMVNWAEGFLDLKKDADKAFSLMKADFEQHPELHREFALPYFNLLNSMKSTEMEALLAPFLQKVETAGDKNEEDFTFLIAYYNKMKDAEKVNEIKTEFKSKFPVAIYFQRMQFNDFYRETDLSKKLELADKFRKDYPASDYHNDLSDLLINYYRDNKMYTEALLYINIHKATVMPYRYYTLALKMYEEEYDASTTLTVADMGIAKALAEYEHPTEKKAERESIADNKFDRGWMIAMNLYVKGLLLERMGKSADALQNMKKNMVYSKGRDDKFNALFAKLLLAQGETDEAVKTGENAIVRGFDNKDVVDILRQTYIKKNGNGDGFSDYLAALEKLQRDKLIAKLSKDQINQPAPQFTLTDLSGKEVSLADYKGKTVIIDFWATWCGPCLQSFPGMQNAVDKFAGNDKVKFLFINAWERVTDKKTNAEEFIAKRKYTFHVVMDYDNAVIAEFGVSGIPTKYIVDKNGNIRFKSVGFSGNIDHLVKELEAMVTMIQ